MPVDNSSKYNDKALCIFPRDENKTKYLKLEFQILLDIKWGSVKMFKGMPTLSLKYFDFLRLIYKKKQKTSIDSRHIKRSIYFRKKETIT